VPFLGKEGEGGGGSLNCFETDLQTRQTDFDTPSAPPHICRLIEPSYFLLSFACSFAPAPEICMSFWSHLLASCCSCFWSWKICVNAVLSMAGVAAAAAAAAVSVSYCARYQLSSLALIRTTDPSGNLSGSTMMAVSSARAMTTSSGAIQVSWTI
jgi:hypothetical protein